MNLWNAFLPQRPRRQLTKHSLVDIFRPHPDPPHQMPNTTAPVIPNLLIKLNAYRYRPSIKEWKHIHFDKAENRKYPSQVRIITWNVNYDALGVMERLNAALRHLELDILGCRRGEAPEPCCILLQELNANAYPHLLADTWVRKNFVVAPRSPDKWPARATYGNVTLISRSVPITGCAIMHFASSIFQRTGVIVDIRLFDPTREDDSRSATSVVRIINTHLESLSPGLEARRLQLDILSKLLFVGGERSGGVIAGDMNAIGPNEHEFPSELGLRDAWNKGEGTKEGHTWGYQGPSQYPAGRLDKVLYLPLDEYEVDTPQRVGMGVIVKDLESGNDMPQYVSDHYGLDTVLRMTG